MKKNILLILMAPLFLMAADAQAQEGEDEDFCFYEEGCSVYAKNFYLEVFGGANFSQKTSIDGNKAKYQTGYTIDALLGFYWERYGLSLEGEYAYRRNAIRKIDFFTQGSSTNGHLQTSSVMANLLWDLLGCAFWKIQPYVGAGVGYDFEQMDASNSRIVFNQKWNHFSWQVMAGLAYPIFRKAEITLEYKFHEGGHFKNNSVGVGLVYKFGYLR